MKTAEEIIVEMKELPPGEIKKVAEYLCSQEEVELSPSEMEELHRLVEEADREENLSPVFSNAQEAIEWLNTPDDTE